MMAYREGPPVAGLPLPRKNIALFTGFAVVLAVMVFVLPLPLFVTRRGMEMFREGGLGMFLLVAAALFTAAGVGLAGAFAVRGHRTGTTALVVLPVVPALLGALLGAFASSRVFAALAGEGVQAEYRVRILGAGLGEADALPAYGCFVSALACGAACIALLGGGASVDRRQHHAPAGAAWAAPLALGGLAFIVAVVLRLALRTGYVTLLFAVPSLAMVTTLACLAALNAQLVRHWREPREADTWSASMLAAALLAAAGLVLLDRAACLQSEGHTLGALAGEFLDPSQRARILASLAEEHGAYRIIAVVDAVFAFLVVATVGVAGLARATNGRLRLPRGAPLYVAAASVAALALALTGARAWAMSRGERLAQGASASRGMESGAATGAGAGAGAKQADDAEDAPAAFELPRVPNTARLSSSASPGAVLHVDAEGKTALRPSPGYARANVLVVEADRRATWGDVSKAIRDVVHASQTDLGAQRITSLELRVTLLEKADRSLLGPYAFLLGAETSSLRVALPTGAQNGIDEEDDDLHALRRGSAPTLIRPRAGEIMDGIAASLAMRPTRFGASSSPDVAPDFALMPPVGAW